LHTNKSILAVFLILAYLALSAAIFFACAGRTDLPLAWLYFGLNTGLAVLFGILVARISPDLMAERIKPGPGDRDRNFKLANTFLTILRLVLAGLDVGHYHWTAPVAPAVQIAALALVFLGYDLTTWAVLTNRFFSSAIRLQPDRHQVVIDKGPYAYIRHPGYTGAIPFLALSGLALGSWLSTLVTGIPVFFLIIRRTLLEDAMLRKGLDGYEEYAGRVKYRLIPGVW